MSVVAPLELHELLTLGVSARQSDHGHSCLGTRVHKAHHLHGWKQSLHKLGQPPLKIVASPIACSARRLMSDRLYHRRVRMTKDQRPPTVDVIHIAITIDINQVWPLTRLDNERIAPNRLKGAHRRINAAGEKRLCFREYRLRPSIFSHTRCVNTLANWKKG